MSNLTRWRYILVFIICFMSIYYAIPSFYPAAANSPIGRFLPTARINLGLDLKGGVSMLLEVDYKQYQREQKRYLIDRIASTVRSGGYGDRIVVDHENASLLLEDGANSEVIQTIKKEVGSVGTVNIEDNTVKIIFSDMERKASLDRLIAQTIEIVRRRIDESGTKEIDLQRQGENYIMLQVPGVSNPEEIKNLLAMTAKLSFSIVDTAATSAWQHKKQFTVGTKILESEHGPIAVKNKIELTGEMLETAHTTVNNSKPGISVRLTTTGAKIFADVTKANSGKQLAIILDNKILSAPVINEPILTGNCFISGNFTIKSANELALLLRAGSLPTSISIAEERTVGPSLGNDSIESGTLAVLVGTAFVIITMILFYGTFGMIANVAMIMNLFMLITVLALFGATLTLPGIAGIVLTLGMSVDANVLIFERIKEEIRNGRTPLSAIESGYNMALVTILDSNITTVLSALIMYFMGSGPIKGFAVTLCIGIGCSMFTAITLTRAIIDIWYRRYRPKKLCL